MLRMTACLLIAAAAFGCAAPDAEVHIQNGPAVIAGNEVRMTGNTALSPQELSTKSNQWLAVEIAKLNEHADFDVGDYGDVKNYRRAVLRELFGREKTFTSEDIERILSGKADWLMTNEQRKLIWGEE